MKRKTLSVILMAYNEEATIEQEIKAYFEVIIRRVQGSEMVIAEDGSRDKTREIIRKLSKKIPLILSTTRRRRGYARSLQIALKKARGDIVFYADSGKKHNPFDFWKLYPKIGKYDLVSGYKNERSDSWYRLLSAWGLNAIINMYFKTSFKDIDSGFKLFTKSVKQTLLKKPWILKNNISLELVLRAIYAGYNIYEVPIKHFSREGKSRSLPLKKIPQAIINVFISLPKIKKDAAGRYI
jgi:glycosyltransferase involved in cell wall biosynthesis